MPEDIFAVIGLFNEPRKLVRAAESLRREGFLSLQAYTPFPVRGIEGVLGLKRSPLAGLVLAMGLSGTALAWLMEWWMNSWDYPIVVGGKPIGSWQAYVPIMFEVMVLLSCLTAAFGMLLLLNRLPKLWHPVIVSGVSKYFTRDSFALAVEAGPGFDPGAARTALTRAGARETIDVPAVPPARPVGVRALVRLALTGTIFSVICGLGMYWLVKLWPVLPPMGHMLAQRRVDAQMSSRFFADGRAMRLPDAATVARGRMADVMPSAGRAADPLPVTQNVLSLGRHAYEVNCAVCHGAVADGKPLLSAAYGGKPANLQEPKYLAYSDGRIHGIITNGYNIMPSYAYTLDDAQRWQVVLYLRALQRAQHAKDSDLP